jgi:hypothetical protein
VLRDVRGYFQETWNSQRYRECGLPGHMLQDNVSWSVGGVVRGLHYQHPHPQGKLVYVLEGETFDVAVDIRALLLIVIGPSVSPFEGHPLRILISQSPTNTKATSGIAFHRILKTIRHISHLSNQLLCLKVISTSSKPSFLRKASN